MVIGFLRSLLVIAILAATAASFAPLFDTNAWWIRILDFPRMQLLVGLTTLLVFYVLFFRPLVWWDVAVCLLGAAAIAYHGFTLYPYMPFADRPVRQVAKCDAASRLSILSANVEESNREADRVIERVRETDPDVFLAMETDPWWDEKLAVLEDMFPHSVAAITANTFGMHLFSKLPLLEPDVRREVGTDTPAIFTGIMLPNGTEARLLAIHPRPPATFQSASNRDRQILRAAGVAQESASPAIVVGDFNAVPWERVLHQARGVGKLLDPRQGHGFMNSYRVGFMPMVAWPLDYVLFQDTFALLSYELLPEVGSDHYPLYAVLCHGKAAAD
ncbi:endonuclease/exonuclease/phosphatase family protein [Caenispirillum salinarum]|uniref:endonuclease/exonuclease/phosphatase family protein n=1 Tax=Caenispirillum salinarum TaxID=859058 RepID=UPI0038513455